MHLTVVLTALTFLTGSFGLAWGISNLQSAAIADEFRSYETRVLRFEGFPPAAAKRVIDSTAARNLSDCDTHAQRLHYLKYRGEVALRSGKRFRIRSPPAIHPVSRRTSPEMRSA